MDPAQRTRLIQLGVLGVVLLAVVQFVLIPSLATPVAPAGPVASPPPATRPAGRAGAAKAGAGPIEVRLEALTRPGAAPDTGGPQRNPFRMGAATPAPGEAGGPGGPRVPPKPVTPVVTQPIGPPQPPPLPPIPYRFIGVLAGAPGRGRIAVLTDGKNVVHGQVNTEVEGRYRIVQIGEESLQIEYIDGRGRQTLRLLGQ
jgi:hypothetical protein